MKKLFGVILALSLILSCLCAVYADSEGVSYNSAGYFSTAFAKTTGSNVALGSSGWRSLNFEAGEGKMGTDGAAWFQIDDGKMYLGAWQQTGRSGGQCRYNSGDTDIAALVFDNASAALTGSQDIRFQAYKVHSISSYGVRFMVHNSGNSYYAIIFGGTNTDPHNGGGDQIAYKIYKVNNGSFTVLKEVKVADVDGQEIKGGRLASFSMSYRNGNISFNLDAYNGNTHELTYSDSVTDPSPFSFSPGDTATVWLTAQGSETISNDNNRSVFFRNIRIDSLDTETTTGYKYGLLKYDLTKETIGGTTTATAVLKGWADDHNEGTDGADFDVPAYVTKDDVDYKVIRVADHAFDKSSSYGSDNVEHANFEHSQITEIGEDAFYGQQYLLDAKLPATLTTLSMNVFRGCSRIKDINIPEGVTTIYGGTFFNLATVNALTVTFEGTSALTLQKSPSDKNVFGNNTKQVTLKVCSVNPKNSLESYITSIGVSNVVVEPYTKSVSSDYSDALFDYSVSSNTYIEDGVDKTGFSASVKGFNDDGLEYEEDGETLKQIDLVIPAAVIVDDITYPITEIADNAFYVDYSHNIIKSVTVQGNNLKTIGDSAFRGQRDLTEVVLPESLTSLGRESFKGCLYLKKINIPAGVTEIKAQTFYLVRSYGASGLVVDVEGNSLTLGSGAFSSNKKIYFITDNASVQSAISTFFGGDTTKYELLTSSNENTLVLNGNELLFNITHNSPYYLILAGYTDNGVSSERLKGIELTAFASDTSNKWNSYTSNSVMYNADTYDSIKAFVFAADGFTPFTPVLQVK